MRALYDVPAPAKLNLFLHITGRRPDGYHLLQSVFMLVDWHDTLHFELRPGGGLSREDLGPPLPADDLVLRAARALQQATGSTAGAHIQLEKRVPAQAGMGGGSSDAASCLLALNRLWRAGLTLQQLERIGLALGADVPFFLRGRNAWVEGIGEIITPIALPKARFAVVKPARGLATSDIFRSPALKREKDSATISGFAANPFGFGCNDLEPVACQLCPDVGEALDWLGSQGLRARMTGSGSAVFALLPPGATLAPSSSPANCEVRECSNMEVHPLVGWAPSDDSVVG
ncbi:MAG: 4-(cytidine 5-diphospho)-2-C-methyl-D-erythritol kinase [Ramlibacter sp.]|jgi:4-diphosphocytidyl-2-C-methyl-D-erythritol kinase|uniref:4-(cytidine 5'-diphospho)-2-C-methyl-D-erythritol kinase n=1 Tax=Ramlibacter sp. TaxID=1917967 RepID=UPI00261E545D|nr:4-(cytidine 5'-diphospho)-2-C-methyl-D-erythritol kinase [Ramlibacter sp.]MDB5753525.1 4-(cytidine 5-diphospho)-2-C-methyl-D-erythritol kinase [Ramlibacter sp.]